MKQLKSLIHYFSYVEIILWGFSAILIISSFFIFDRSNYLTLIASLLGSTALIFNAKGNMIGQLMMVVFSILYGIISYSFAYYGEMITYLGMSAPMAVFAFISWLRNPYNGNKTEVRVNRLTLKEVIFMVVITALVTVIFYYILDTLNTSNLIPSTISVTTSFAAVYLTARRSPYYAIAYALNDVVLIILWVYASTFDMSYFAVIICFIVFLVNDLYGFLSWLKMQKRQES